MRSPEMNRVWVVAALLATGLNILSWQQPFFWDTLLTSSVVQHWLDAGPGNLILPARMDAGHPPLFYLYLWCWLKYLGARLWVAHLAMLPFTLAGVWAFLRILRHFNMRMRSLWTGLLLFFAIPAVAAQYSLVSYDAVLLTLYLLALLFYLEGRRGLFALALVMLAGITGRGLFAIGALGFTALSWHRASFRKWLPACIPALGVYAGWYTYHDLQTGYIFAPDNGWSEHRGLASAQQVFRNLVSIARTQFDLGIVVLFAANIAVYVRHRDMALRYWIWMIPLLVFSAAFIFLTNPVNHRYYLVVYVLMLIPVLRALEDRPLYQSVLLVIVLACGHFQIYPKGISNGWDCTLAHRPYHRLKKEALAFAEKQGLVRQDAGSVFPMVTSPRQDAFSGDPVRLVNVHGEPVDSVPYVLYSNVGNDFSDEQLAALKRWRVLYTRHRGVVEMTWYENPAKLP